MPSKYMRIAAVALVTLTPLASLSAQSDKVQSDSVERIEAARKGLFIGSREDSQRFRSQGYLPGKIGELRGLIREEILRQLNRGQWSDSTLLPSLSRVLTKDSEPLSLIHKQLNGLDFVIIGYSIRHGASAIPDSTVVIEAYRKGADGYELADQAGEGLTNSIPKLEELPCPWTNEIWLLGHGQQTGVMQYHERVRIYSFDGQHFKELWSHEPLKQASFQVEGNEVRITFEKEDGSAAGSMGRSPWMVLKLGLLPQGPREISLLEKQ